MILSINSVKFSYTLYNHSMNKDNICIWDPMVKKGGATVFVSTVCIADATQSQRDFIVLSLNLNNTFYNI